MNKTLVIEGLGPRLRGDTRGGNSPEGVGL